MKRPKLPHPLPDNYTVVYGPPASGKTLNRDRIADLLDCDEVMDDEPFIRTRLEYHQSPVRHLLILSPDRHVRDPRERRRFLPPHCSISIDEVKSRLGSRWVEPNPNL